MGLSASEVLALALSPRGPLPPHPPLPTSPWATPGFLHCLQPHCLPSLPLQQRELNSFLWTIRRDPPAYLFGTIHVPYTRVWDFIPDNSKAAFQASARVYFELDLTDPYTISALASCQLLPHGENLQDVLPRELYWRLKRHLDYVKLMMPSWMTPAQRGKGLYADYLFNAIAGNWERKRPVWVMLMVNSLTETDVRSRGVPVLDLYLAQQAERMKKSTGAVERVEEQCHPLNGLNFSQVGAWLNRAALLSFSPMAFLLQAPSYGRGSFLWERLFRVGRHLSGALSGGLGASWYVPEFGLRVGVSASISTCYLLGLGTPHLLCLPERKEFSWEHQSEENKKSKAAGLCPASPRPPGSQEQEAVLRRFREPAWAAACMDRGCAEGVVVPAALGAGDVSWTRCPSRQGMCRGPGAP